MDVTPHTHKGWRPFVYLYFCVLFVILAALTAYLALAVRQGSEVTEHNAVFPSNETSQLFPNLTGGVLQRAAEGSTMTTEPEWAAVQVLAEEEVSTRLDEDEENGDSSTRSHVLNATTTRTATTTTTKRRGSRGHGRLRGKSVRRRRRRKTVDQHRTNAATSSRDSQHNRDTPSSVE